MRETKIETPAGLQFPYSAVKDHGMALVHDTAGAPLCYIHEVSVWDKSHAEMSRVAARGYRRHSGYKDGTAQFWVYTGEHPLSVGEFE